MLTFTQSWFLSVVPIGIGIILQLLNMKKMKETHSEIHGVLRNRFDLEKVKIAISLNMSCAMLYIAVWLLVVVFGIYLVATKNLGLFSLVGHMMIFGIVTLPFGIIGKKDENLIKKLEIESEDPYIEKKFRDYLRQWNQPQLKIHD
ncbi:hypothetical protein JXI42_12625 [bacterium]|nr:hypothetical protein [bacterium]